MSKVSCRGVARNLFRRGKRVGSVTSGVQNPGWGLGQSLQKSENYAENLIECKNSLLFRGKNFQRGNFGGDMSPCPPSLRPWYHAITAY